MAKEISSTVNSNSSLNPRSERLLPPEILTLIFNIVQADCARTESLHWIVVSHVSSHWRECALHHQRLWATLNTAVLGGGFLNVFLKRSGKAPLKIIMSDRYEQCTVRSTYRVVLTLLLHRVQELSFASTGSEKLWHRRLAEQTALLLDSPAPMLRTLCLPGIAKSNSIIEEGHALHHFLSDLAPNIKHVELEKGLAYYFPWVSPPTYITTLALSGDADVEKASSFSFITLLDGLRAMPYLEALELSGLVPPCSKDASHAAVQLSHLQAVRFNGRGDQYSMLLYLLKPSIIRSLRLQIVEMHDAELLRAAWTQIMLVSDLSALSEMVVEETSTSRLSFTMFPPDQIGNGPDSPLACPCIDISVAGDFSRTDWDWDSFEVPSPLSAEFLSATPVNSLKSLTLRTYHDKYIAQGTFGDLARRAPCLETLIFENYKGLELATLFTTLAAAKDRAEFDAEKDLVIVRTVLVPQLRTLQFRRCRFDEHVAVPALRRALERRTPATAKLESIVFADCSSGSARVEELKSELVQLDLVQSISHSNNEAGDDESVNLVG